MEEGLGNSKKGGELREAEETIGSGCESEENKG